MNVHIITSSSLSEEKTSFLPTENPIITFPSGDGDRDNLEDENGSAYIIPPSKFNSNSLTDDYDPNDTSTAEEIHPDVKLRKTH